MFLHLLNKAFISSRQLYLYRNIALNLRCAFYDPWILNFCLGYVYLLV